jgi:hypothetical protein
MQAVKGKARGKSSSSALEMTVAVAFWATLLNGFAAYRFFAGPIDFEADQLWRYLAVSMPIIVAAIYFLISRKTETRWKVFLAVYVMSWFAIGAKVTHGSLEKRGYLEIVRIRQKDGSVREVYRFIDFPHMVPKQPIGGRR